MDQGTGTWLIELFDSESGTCPMTLAAPSVIGKILAYCHEEKQWFIRKPKQKEYEKEFPNCGNWYSIRSYFTERSKGSPLEISIEL